MSYIVIFKSYIVYITYDSLTRLNDENNIFDENTIHRTLFTEHCSPNRSTVHTEPRNSNRTEAKPNYSRSDGFSNSFLTCFCNNDLTDQMDSKMDVIITVGKVFL